MILVFTKHKTTTVVVNLYPIKNFTLRIFGLLGNDVIIRPSHLI